MHSFTMRWFYSIPLLLEMQPQGTGRGDGGKGRKIMPEKNLLGALVGGDAHIAPRFCISDIARVSMPSYTPMMIL